MRHKLSLITVLALFATITFLSTQAISANLLWADVTIDGVYYMEDGSCVAYFTESDPTNPVFTKKPFKTAKSADSKAILAVILSAQSMGKNLKVAFTDDGSIAQLVRIGIANN